MRKLILFVTVLLSIVWSTTAFATTIEYDVSDLGGGTWEYTYTLTDFTFTATPNYDTGFTIFFDYTTYDALVDTSPTNLDWDPILNPVDKGLSGDGYLDELASTSTLTLPDVFSVQFTWSGTGTPGPQSFEVYEFFDDGSLDGILNTIETGFTSRTAQMNPIPEPGTLTLLGFGMLALASTARRKTTS